MIRTIHQLVGPSPSPLVRTCLDSWKILENHGFKLLYWDDQKIFDFVNAFFPEYLDPLVSARNFAELADIARYLIIFHYGGYYVDWDIRLNNIQKFLYLDSTIQSGYLVIDPFNDTLASEHFSSMPGNEYFYFLVKDINHTFIRGERELLDTPHYSGPYRMKTALQRYKKSDLRLIPVDQIFEYNYREIRS